MLVTVIPRTIERKRERDVPSIVKNRATAVRTRKERGADAKDNGSQSRSIDSPRLLFVYGSCYPI